MNLNWLKQATKPLNEEARRAAHARQQQLTKPAGSLGKLEAVAIQLAALQGCEKPQAEKIFIGVFAGDHGVAQEGVSAFPQAVTAEMVKNFARGGAAISVLAKKLGATLEVVNLSTAFDTGELPGVLQCNLGKGTANFAQEAAMTQSQLAAALQAGSDSAARAEKRRSDAPLSESGFSQMAKALQDAPQYHAVLSPPLVRCAAFAQDFAQRHS